MQILNALEPAAAEAVRLEVETLARTPAGLAPTPLVTGDDLIAAGFTPGPKFRHLLDRVYDAQLEGRVCDRAAAMELASRIAGS
jgi:hypothetical protein